MRHNVIYLVYICGFASFSHRGNFDMNNEIKLKYEEVSSKHYLTFILSLSFSFLFLSYCNLYRIFFVDFIDIL